MARKPYKHRCIHPDCNTRPRFGYPGTKKALYCTIHKGDSTENVSDRRCEFSGCKRQPSFGTTWHKPRFCLKHKDEDMINVVSKRCEHGGCLTQPNFAFRGKRASHCAEHKHAGMVDVCNQRCAHSGCETRPTFGHAGGRRKFCASHKVEGMEYLIKSQSCAKEECTTRPYYGSGHRPTHCAEHKRPGMKCFRNNCTVQGCGTMSTFGRPGDEHPSRCAIHRDEGMENIANRSCEFDGCKVHPTYADGGVRPAKRCFTHRLPNQSSVLEKTCVACGLRYIIFKGDLCRFCDPSSKAAKSAREEKVAAFLAAELPGVAWARNRRLPDRSCPEVLSRPDFLVDRGSFYVVLEVDQFQHSGVDYTQSCELSRMYNIVAALGLPTYFVRYNPDGFKLNGRATRIDTKRRLRHLKSEIEKGLGWEPRHGEMMKVVQVFYDWDGPCERIDEAFCADVTDATSQRLDELRRSGEIALKAF